MQVLWRHPESTAQEVIEHLAQTASWSPATVRTLLNRLLNKGALLYEKEGKAYRYRAAFSEEACRRSGGESFLARFFNGALSPMLAHFIQSRKLSDAELAELEALVREQRKKP